MTVTPELVPAGVKDRRRGVAAPPAPAAADRVDAVDGDGDGARAGDGGGRGIIRERDGVLACVEDEDILVRYPPEISEALAKAKRLKGNNPNAWEMFRTMSTRVRRFNVSLLRPSR